MFRLYIVQCICHGAQCDNFVLHRYVAESVLVATSFSLTSHSVHWSISQHTFLLAQDQLLHLKSKFAVLSHYFYSTSQRTLSLWQFRPSSLSQAHILGHLVTATCDDSFPNSRISQQLAAMLNISDSRITLPINALDPLRQLLSSKLTKDSDVVLAISTRVLQW